MDKDQLTSILEKIQKNNAHRLAQAALALRPLNKIASNPLIHIDTNGETKVPFVIPVRDQKHTGTCWMQAGFGFLASLAKSRGFDITPSMPHLLFFDKIEKSNWFLHIMQDKTLKKRHKWHLMQDPIGDGGTWAMFVYLVHKYGVIPAESYKSTYQATSTGQINQRLKYLLRKRAIDIKNGDKTIENTMEEVINLISRAYTTPPSDVVLYEKNHGKNFKGTAVEFVESLLGKMESYKCIADAPHLKEGVYRTYFSNNASKLRDQHTFWNVGSDIMMKAAQESLDIGIPVWFTADVSRFFDSSRKIMHPEVFDYNLVLGADVGFDTTKKERLQLCMTEPNHAMLLIGLKKNNNGDVTHWVVQNSWGNHNGAGIIAMDPGWFRDNVFEIAVDIDIFKKYVHIPETEPVLLQPWDPFSTVAKFESCEKKF